ncbi:MAG: hypothetical protein U5O69_09070 [Candidatus Competibacteraceae bacterium]|nr:hypothetical protein [Candidatus Competibacteraceae bacterium]
MPKKFQEQEVVGIMIDMRNNGGGDVRRRGWRDSPTDQELIQGQLEYFSEKTGKFEPEGETRKIYPKPGRSIHLTKWFSWWGLTATALVKSRPGLQPGARNDRRGGNAHGGG